VGCFQEVPKPTMVQLQARWPHVARHSVISGPLKNSGKILKSEIC